MINLKAIGMQFAEELFRRMEDEGLSAKGLADYCHVSKNKIEFCIQLGSLPDVWTLILMADCLWCTVDDLLGYSGLGDPEELLKYQAIEAFSDKREYAERISSKIRRHTRDIGLTTEDLASSADVNVYALRQWISITPSIPHTSDLLRLVDALNCTPSDLLWY